MRMATAMVLTVLAIPQAALADSGDIRSMADATSQDGDARKNALRRIYALIGQTDHDTLQPVRLKTYDGNIGPFDLALMASHAKGRRAEVNALSNPASRLNVHAVGLTLASDIGGLTISSDILLTNMKRYSDIVPSGIRPRATGIAMAGMGLERDGGLAVRLDYVRVGLSGRRPLAERMSELAGGAPLAGRGLQLAMNGGARGDDRGGIHWSLSAAVMRRSASELGLNAARGSFADNRTQLSLRMAF